MVVLHSDAYKYGIGGYTDIGLAWQWHILPQVHENITLNLL